LKRCPEFTREQCEGFQNAISGNYAATVWPRHQLGWRRTLAGELVRRAHDQELAEEEMRVKLERLAHTVGLAHRPEDSKLGGCRVPNTYLLHCSTPLTTLRRLQSGPLEPVAPEVRV
jgi:hypothetical protein